MSKENESFLQKFMLAVLPQLLLTIVTIFFIRQVDDKIGLAIKQKSILFDMSSEKVGSLYNQFPIFATKIACILNSGYYTMDSMVAKEAFVAYKIIVENFVFLDIYYVKDDSILKFVQKLKSFYIDDVTELSYINEEKQKLLRKQLEELTKDFIATTAKIHLEEGN